MTVILPAEALDQHIAAMGKTGSGKTYAIKGVVELLLDDGRQVAIVDPTGAWWGLRCGPTGKPKGGYDVLILGGKHQDMPLAPGSGAAVARLVCEQRVNVICDTQLMTVGERTRWFTEFATAIMRLIVRPLTLVIDEVHNFAPKGKVPDPAIGACMHAANSLFSGGRSMGLRMIGITQRPAKWHNDSLTSCDTIMALRMIAPADREAIEDWIDGCGDKEKGKEVLNSLANLPKGEGWVWFPEGGILKRTKFPAIKTYDSSATPTERERRNPPSLAEIDLSAVRASMEDAVKEAEANDPKLLRRQIAELKAAAGKVTKAAPVAAAPVPSNAGELRRLRKAVEDLMKLVVRINAEGLTGGDSPLDKAEIQKVLDQAVERGTQLIQAKLDARANQLERLRLHGEKVLAGIKTLMDDKTMEVVVDVTRNQPFTVAPRVSKNAPAPGRVQSGLTTPHQKIVDALAWWGRLFGDERPTVTKVAFKAGYAPGGGSFNNYLSALTTAGLIKRGNGTCELTPDGKTCANWPDAAEGLEQLLASVEEVLEAPQWKVLRTLLDGGGELSTSDLASVAGYAAGGGSFNNYLSRLSTLGLIERGGGTVRAAEFLMGGGSR